VLADADAGTDQDPGQGRGVKTAHLTDHAVTEPKLADGAVSTRAVAAGAIDEPRLAAGAVSTRALQDGAVTAARLQSDRATDTRRAVGPDHLQSKAVESRALAPADPGTDQTLTRGAGVKTGHLTDEAVTTAKLARNAVTADRLLASATDSASRAVGPHHIQEGTVAITQLRSVLVADQEVAVAAAPGPGQVAEAVVIVDLLDDLAFYLVGVHFVGPRLPVLVSGIASFTWTRRTSLVKPLFPPDRPYTHRHELVIQNPSTMAITVACRVYRLLQE
jgi:hypothetical protein